MFELNLRHILERSRLYFAKKEIVSRVDGEVFRYDYGSFYGRVSKLANALKNSLKVSDGDRIASICWNTHRHFELQFGIPCTGAVLHTVNARFSAEQISSTINHAEDKVVFLDSDLLPLVERIAGELRSVERFVIMGKSPETRLPNTFLYEDLLRKESSTFEFPNVREDSPAVLCYTTGTTGEPKGAMYAHRGIFLRSLAACMTDTFGLSESDTILHVVPMYHISGWLMHYSATMVGSKQVFPGMRPTSETLSRLIRSEAVTVSDGVPSVWMDLLDFVEARGKKDEVSSLKKLVIGGSALPRPLLESLRDRLGITAIHAWGMTETYDAATSARLKSYLEESPKEFRYSTLAKQGLPFPGIEVEALGEDGKPIAWDGKQKGELTIRGAWVIDRYYKSSSKNAESFAGDWFRTGDIVTIDNEGYMEIVDRSKDLVRSGGESISSILLENAIMGHPAVLEAAVIAVPDMRWGERPLAVVVSKPDFRGSVSKEKILDFLAGKVPKWYLPGEVVFVESIPKTSIGKFDKKALRQSYGKPKSP